MSHSHFSWNGNEYELFEFMSQSDFSGNGNEYELVVDMSFWEQPFLVETFIDDDYFTYFYTELSDKLAREMYNSIRSCDTDICDIAKNLGFKVENIKNVKEHIFYNEHNLDRYGPDEIEHKRFDATLEQALVWKRLQAGTHTPDDINWIKYECAERHHELKYSSGYSEAHNRAQSRYDGYPWENKFKIKLGVKVMRFSKTDNIYKIIRITGSQDNILGISFAEPSSSEANIEVIEWDFPNSDRSRIRTSKKNVLEQVLFGLESINKSLGTNYKLSKIYFSPFDSGANLVYKLLICKLIRHYHYGKEFKEI